MNMDKEKFFSELEEELKRKQFIAEEKINREILKGVDVIGFDVDHTLSIYNTKSMIKLLYESFSEYLFAVKKYPRELLCYEKNKDFIIKFCHLEILLHYVKGNALKIDKNKKIVKAFHGIKELTPEEISKEYPTGTFDDYENGVNYKQDSYYLNKCNFEPHIIPLYQLCVHYFDKGEIKGAKDYEQMKNDIFESMFFSFKPKDAFADFKASGFYFPEIAKHPDLYLFKKYNSAGLLKKLRDKGIKIFFATNSYYTYSDFIMRNTIGEDFEKYFDVGSYLSKKPLFFEKDGEKKGVKCYFKDKTNIPISKMDDETYKKLAKEKIFIEGNYEVIENFFKKELKKDKLNIVYVGDDIFHDCYAPKAIGWHSIYINDTIRTGFIGEEPEGYCSIWKKEDDDPKVVDVKSDAMKNSALISLSNVEEISYFI